MILPLFLKSLVIPFFKKKNYLFIFGCGRSSLLARVFPSYAEQELLLIAVYGLLIVVASLVAEHRL